MHIAEGMATSSPVARALLRKHHTAAENQEL